MAAPKKTKTPAPALAPVPSESPKPPAKVENPAKVVASVPAVPVPALPPRPGTRPVPVLMPGQAPPTPVSAPAAKPAYTPAPPTTPAFYDAPSSQPPSRPSSPSSYRPQSPSAPAYPTTPQPLMGAAIARGGKAAIFPKAGEFVFATVRKIVPYGAFLTLDEFNGAEALMHISEVSSGWVKNIRDHLKEGSRVVVLVSQVNPDKHQVDVSLKRVRESDRRRIIEGRQKGVRAEKLLERIATSIGKTLADAQKQLGAPLATEFGDAYTGLEAIALGEPAVTSAIPKEWMDAALEVASNDIKPKEYAQRANLTMTCYEGDGVERVKRVLAAIPTFALKGVRLDVHYLGAPRYYIDAAGEDAKALDKTLGKIENYLSDSEKKEKIEFALEREKGG